MASAKAAKAKNPKFSAGDLVELKSGGPPMTVAAVMENAPIDGVVYRCQWFRGAKVERENFRESVLIESQPRSAAKAEADAKAVANFMVSLALCSDDGALDHSVAAEEIVKRFGRTHVNMDKSGALAISEAVLKLFAERTPDFTWEPGTKTWRQRVPGEKGRSA